MVFLDTIISSGVGWLLLILVWGQCEGLKSGMGEKLETPMPFLFPFVLSESVLRGSRSRVDSFFGILKRKNRRKDLELWGKDCIFAPRKLKYERLWKQEYQVYQLEEGSPRLGELQWQISG